MSPLAEDRLITFELGGTLYALPIAAVSEVAEPGPVAGVPTLPREVGGVMNHHGDALPVIFGAALFGGSGASSPANLLVLGTDPDDQARYGLPVDSVLGLVDGRGARSADGDPVAERRPIEGRLFRLLDPERLLERAARVIGRSMSSRQSSQGGES